jgi:NAD-dependent SIR2 family protein deacetylase
MCPLRDYTCLNCEAELTDMLVSNSETPTCEKCGSDQLQPHLSTHGGYSIKWSRGDSAVKKSAGSFKKGGSQ